MNATQTAGQVETVIVTVRGRILDSASFGAGAEAEAYKRGVRRWAFEKGIVIGLWSRRRDWDCVEEGTEAPRAAFAAAG
ncbi:MAG: hypothetical protein Q7T33_11420 [Dehalococcoidia bacterium]|nr:hypothetical protein [Dehalococcoidia bacterium]